MCGGNRDTRLRPYNDFAQALANYVGPMQSAENVPLAMAKHYAWKGATPEDILESAEEECSWAKGQCESAVDDPCDWMFFIGEASYNQMGGAIEAWLGWGGEVDSENLKVKKVPQ